MGFKLSSEARLQLHSSAWIKAQTGVILLVERKWEARLFCLHRVCQTRFLPSYGSTGSQSVILSQSHPISSHVTYHFCHVVYFIAAVEKGQCVNWSYFAVVLFAVPYYLVHQVFLLHWSAEDFFLQGKQPLIFPTNMSTFLIQKLLPI